MKRSVVHLAEAAAGRLRVLGGGGTYHILIDEPTTGGRDVFSLLLNEVQPGGAEREHAHDIAHRMQNFWGGGRFTLEGKQHPVGAGTAVFVPAHARHSLTGEGDEPFQYVVIYARGGPEKE